ncbi:glycosyltransferase [Cellulomonas sp. GbtcB1]|uniref:glycosyltransferase n=1 Tax=Cellulomonas sp. GbtcB1 TaxID=2824746 RepID=UPI001C2F8DA2|nr:glycosyltransferase [Cellulomonas sp. GbtcB1]
MSQLLAPTAGAPRSTSRTVRVASVPAGHPYVARVTAAAGVELLPDPTPPGAEPGRWWPPVVLDPAWVRAHAAEADLLHVHFGTESFAPEHLARTLAAAREQGWPVVVTVHDLEHPQLTDQDGYRAQLDVLVPGADALVTLTPGAAAEIRARWGRDARVVPHPRLLGEVPEGGGAPAPGGERVVGLHLKDLRPNVDAPAATRALLAAVADLRASGVAVRAEVRLHRAVRDEAARAEVRALCAAAGSAVDLVEHDRLDDDALAAALAGLDACVLPYAHGTHSGWLELCWDLGVPVAAPAVGYYAEQHPDGSVETSGPVGDAAGLAGALRRLLAAETSTRPGTTERAALVRDRRAERLTADRAAAEQHAALYRDLLAGGSR